MCISVLLEGNHIGSTDLSPNGPGGDTILEETGPEETAVKVADTSYQPLRSPSAEELPTFSSEIIAGELITSSPINPQGAAPADLDAQIEELQNELDKCKAEDANADKAPPEDAAVKESGIDIQGLDNQPADRKSLEEPAIVAAVANENTASVAPEKPDEVDAGAPDSQSAVSAGAKSKPPRRCGKICCRAMTVAFFLVFISTVVIFFLVLESKLDLPVVTNIRQLPEVQKFKHNSYDPFKTTVSKKVGGVFQR